MSREGIVVYRARGGIDAIDEYSRRITAGLGARYEPRGLRSVRRAPAPWVLLQYNPFRFGRAGFAPRLVAEAATLSAPLVLMVHEAFIDVRDPRSALIGGYQRVQLRALLRLADAVLVSTAALARRLRGAKHVPVGSTVTPVAVDRAAARERLAVGDELVVALFGRDHPSRALDHAEAALAALTRERPVTVLNLGADAPRLRVPPAARVHSPGPLTADAVSLHLRAADLMLLPLRDGLSTRRTTLMAGLSHGLPVVGLRGPDTEPLLIERLPLVAVGDRAGFARVAVALADDPERRAAVGAAGHALYAETFDWPVVTRTIAAELDRVAA